MQREHELKTWPAYFRAVAEGRKTFEARRDDRGFDEGDMLVLREWEPSGSSFGALGNYTGRQVRRVVTYILRGGDFGVERGHCILALGAEPSEGHGASRPRSTP